MTLYLQHNTGRIVWRYKNFVRHTGVLAGKDEYGRDRVIHNHPSSGATVVTFEEFADGKEVKYDNTPCEFDQQTVWQRALDSVRRGVQYGVLNSNCQHLTSNACKGKSESDDLKAFFQIALLFGGLFLGAAAISSLAKNSR